MRQNHNLIRMLILEDGNLSSLNNQDAPSYPISLFEEAKNKGIGRFSLRESKDLIQNEEEWTETLKKIDRVVDVNQVPFEVILEVIEEQKKRSG